MAEKINIKTKSTVLYCLKCGELSKLKFFDSPYTHHAFAGKIPYCRNCIYGFANEYAKTFGEKNYHIVIFLLCRKLGITFSMDCYKRCDYENKNDVVKNYIKISNQYSESFMVDGFDYGEKLDDAEIFVDDKDDDFDITNEMILFWGTFKNKSDYSFLENEFLNWQRDFACDNYSEKLLIRDICIIDLQLRYANASNDITSAQKLRSSRKDILASGGLNPAALKNAENAKQSVFGCWVEDIEKYMPAEFFEDKQLYKDHDHIEEYTEELIRRPIRNIISDTRDFETPKLDRLDSEE